MEFVLSPVVSHNENQSSPFQTTMEEDEETSNESPAFLQEMKFVSSLIMMGCTVLGLFGNAISSYIFLHPSMISSPINFLLASVSLIDITVLVLVVPTLILPGINIYLQNDGIYQFYLSSILIAYPIALMSHTASSWTYVLVVFERYVAVCKPLKMYKLLTLTQSKIAQSIIVVVSIFYNITRFWEYQKSTDGQIEEYLRSNTFYFFFYFTVLHLFTHFIILLSIIVALNGRIIRTLIKTRKDRSLLGQQSWMECNNKRQNRTAWMIVMATGAFTVTNSFSFIVTAWEAFDLDALENKDTGATVMHVLSDMANILLISHSTFSFLIYLMYCRQYRLLCQRMIIRSKYNIMKWFRRRERTRIMYSESTDTTFTRFSIRSDENGRIGEGSSRRQSPITSSVSRL